MMHEESIRN
jgi:hypothetical protein